jgi:hypothetical protein
MILLSVMSYEDFAPWRLVATGSDYSKTGTDVSCWYLRCNGPGQILRFICAFFLFGGIVATDCVALRNAASGPCLRRGARCFIIMAGY